MADSSAADRGRPCGPTVRQLIAEGRTDQQIEDYLVARYGSAIVLDPPASGWSAAGVAPAPGRPAWWRRPRSSWCWSRRRPPAATATLDADRAEAAGRPRRPSRSGADFLTQSLADADAEYLAGDLSDAGLPGPAPAGPGPAGRAGGRRRPPGGPPPVGRPAAVGRRRRRGPPPAVGGRPRPTRRRAPSPTPAAGTARGHAARRSRRSWWFLGGAVGAPSSPPWSWPCRLFASDRLPGQTPPAQFARARASRSSETLDQAATDENEGQLGLAAQLYQSVLASAPRQRGGPGPARVARVPDRRSRGRATSLIADARAKLDRGRRARPGRLRRPPLPRDPPAPAGRQRRRGGRPVPACSWPPRRRRRSWPRPRRRSGQAYPGRSAGAARCPPTDAG